MQKSIRVLVLYGLAIGSVQAGFVPIDISGVANSTWTALPIPSQTGLKNSSMFPAGTPTTAFGQTFILSGQIWSADKAASFGPGLVSVTIPVNQPNVTTLYTIFNSEWGQPGPTPYLNVQLVFGDSSVLTVNLYGNQDIRDYNQWNWTNSLTSSNSATLWNNGALGQRLDAQAINIPLNLQSQMLLAVIVNDGGSNVNAPGPTQRSFLSGLDVLAGAAPIPEPGSIALMLGGLGLIALRLKRR